WLIRWFTPQVEVDLCGHATLAAAYVLFKDGYEESSRINFKSNSETLSVMRENELLQLDFPSRPGVEIEKLDQFEQALGVEIEAGFQDRDSLLIIKDQTVLRALKPDFQAIEKLETFAIIASAPGDDCDFVSRFFAPGAGIPEDPVTGSAHCTLIPYWSNRLDKQELHARQLSSRGGELFCENKGERVIIGGYCYEYLRGKIFISD
ncbi:MAG: PhzF family phenazine biosynthesis protein, partial [Pseudomonadales bacterium]|nr:PhzF family phenazine biosynthesis protein [Pseudomonadales bacterium]